VGDVLIDHDEAGRGFGDDKSVHQLADNSQLVQKIHERHRARRNENFSAGGEFKRIGHDFRERGLRGRTEVLDLGQKRGRALKRRLSEGGERFVRGGDTRRIWHHSVLKQSPLYGEPNRIEHRPLVLEFDLALGGADVHIDLSGIDFDAENHERETPIGRNVSKALVDRGGERPGSDRTPIHIDILVGSGRLREVRWAYVTVESHASCFELDRGQFPSRFPSPHTGDRLQWVAAAARSDNQLGPVDQREGDVGIGDGVSANVFDRLPQLGGVTLEELEASRGVEEEIFDQNLGSARS
jgi:hypothetical protein